MILLGSSVPGSDFVTSKARDGDGILWLPEVEARLRAPSAGGVSVATSFSCFTLCRTLKFRCLSALCAFFAAARSSSVPYMGCRPRGAMIYPRNDTRQRWRWRRRRGGERCASHSVLSLQLRRVVYLYSSSGGSGHEAQCGNEMMRKEPSSRLGWPTPEGPLLPTS